MSGREIKEVEYHHVPIEKDKSFFFDHVHIFWNEQVLFHQHVEWEISYIITGSGKRIVGDLVETFSRGEIVMLPPNMPHCWLFDEFDHDQHGKIQNTTICFPGALMKNCGVLFPELAASVARIDQSVSAVKFEGDTLKALQHLFIQMPVQTDAERLASLLKMFSIIGATDETTVVGYSKQQNKSAAKMRKIHRFILNHYQREISLDDVASHVGMNRSSLCVFFKRVQGKSLFTYLNEFRIESSCLMLRETQASIAEVCHTVGFNDVPYYNRLFKKMKGTTPNAYRITHQRLSSK
jgi:AraC-like DNA-binding protein